MVEDLAEYALADVEAAIRDYRRDAKMKFFPTSGQLRVRVEAEMRERAAASDWLLRKSYLKPEFGDPRPICWWCQPRAQWREHWRERDIPAEYADAAERSRVRRGEPRHD